MKTLVTVLTLTTLIAGAIMYYLGAGPVRGFAWTLSVGVFTSVFSAVFITQVLLGWWLKVAKPKKLPITNILGMTQDEASPGYAEFRIKGQTLRLEPIVDDGQLFFMFKDATTGKATYPAGRFLYAPIPKDAEVVLDFNQSHNPPCAFTAFATCPLPPRQNTLPVAIEAGEKNYGNH